MKRQLHKKFTAQGLVEFALITPILLLLMMGSIDFGWMVFNFAQLYNSLREGLRYGSVSGYGSIAQYKDCAGIRSDIINLARSSGITDANIMILYDDGTPVQVAYDANGNGNPTDPTTGVPQYSGDTRARAATAYCPTGGTTPQRYTDYVSMSGDTRSDTTMFENGDRLYIDVSAHVHFLTPFLSSWAKDGVTFHLHAARSIYPCGLPVGNQPTTCS